MAQLVVGAIGAAVGGFVGGPTGAQIGWAIGSAVGAQFAPPQRVQGPRLQDLRVMSMEYGTPIPWVKGHPVLAGQVWWSSDRREIATTTEQGGKGGPSVESTTYTYEVDMLIGLTDTEIAGVSRIWANGKLIYNMLATATQASVEASLASDAFRRMTVYTGDAAQLPDPTYEAAVGVGNAPAYRHRGSIFFEGLQLGPSGYIPNITAEVYTIGTTAGAGYVDKFLDMLTPYTLVSGALTNFASDRRYYGQTIEGTSRISATTDIIRRTITTVVATEVYFKFLIIDGNDDDGTIIRLTDGVSTTFAFNPRRELAFDADQRPHIFADGSTDVAIGSSALPTGYWYQLALVIVAGAGNSTLTITNIDTGAVMASVNLAASYLPIDASRLEFYIDSGILITSACAYSDLVLLPARITITDESLDDVVSGLCLRSGLAASQFDVTDLSAITTPVRAIAVSQVSTTRQILEMLGAAYFFEAYLTDKLYFVPRGGASVGSIAFAKMGATMAGDPDRDPFPLVPRSDLEIPSGLALRYMNIDADCSADIQQTDRLTSPARTLNPIEIPLGMTAAEAKAVVDVMLMDQIASSISASISVRVDQAEKTPTDVITAVDEDGTQYRMRIVRRQDQLSVLTFDLVLDDASVLTQTGITSADYTASTTVSAPVDTADELLDIPILRDADDDSGMYAAAKGEASPWPGARLYRSTDDTSFTSIATFTDSTVIGRATDALDDWDGGHVWDEVSTVTVNVGAQTLSSSTRDAMQADSSINVAAIEAGAGGWEIIRFRTATLSSAGIYVLSGLLRGMRGTEWAMGLHAVDDRFVQLQLSGLRRTPSEVTEIGIARYWRTITLGRTLSTALSESLANNAVGKKPFAPVNLRGDRNTSGDIAFTWDRRTRLSVRYGGAGGSYTPLGEDSESYEVDVYDSGVVVRTLTSSSETVTYTAAQQTTDFGGVLPYGVCDAEVFQVSAVVGRGYGCRRVV